MKTIIAWEEVGMQIYRPVMVRTFPRVPTMLVLLVLLGMLIFK